MTGDFEDDAVYAVTCSGCGATSMDVQHQTTQRLTGDVFSTTITCIRCGAALVSVLWCDSGRWYTAGRSVPGPTLAKAEH